LVVALLKSSWGCITAFCIIIRNASLWLITSPTFHALMISHHFVNCVLFSS
jgi:hypothetical protein